MKRCKRYVGVSCVNGSCPVALKDEHIERCMDIIKSCDECYYYKGCEDCGLANAEDCINKSKWM